MVVIKYNKGKKGNKPNQINSMTSCSGITYRKKLHTNYYYYYYCKYVYVICYIDVELVHMNNLTDACDVTIQAGRKRKTNTIE